MPTDIHIDRLIRSRRRSIGLEITEDARLIVRAPRIVPRLIIDQLLRQKQDWILKKKADILERIKKNPPRSFQQGETFWYLGKDIPLVIEYDSNACLRLENDCFCLSGKELSEPEQAFEKWYRRAAQQYFCERVEYFATKHDFQYSKIRLSSAKKRWGSCSSSGTISLSWRLIMAPPEVIDYVIVHELAHLRHLDHSKNFWKLVESILPEYKVARQWLKKEGHGLTV